MRGESTFKSSENSRERALLLRPNNNKLFQTLRAYNIKKQRGPSISKSNASNRRDDIGFETIRESKEFRLNFSKIGKVSVRTS